jgi:hypothetical protein
MKKRKTTNGQPTSELKFSYEQSDDVTISTSTTTDSTRKDIIRVIEEAIFWVPRPSSNKGKNSRVVLSSNDIRETYQSESEYLKLSGLKIVTENIGLKTMMRTKLKQWIYDGNVADMILSFLKWTTIWFCGLEIDCRSRGLVSGYTFCPNSGFVLQPYGTKFVLPASALFSSAQECGGTFLCDIQAYIGCELVEFQWALSPFAESCDKESRDKHLTQMKISIRAAPRKAGKRIVQPRHIRSLALTFFDEVYFYAPNPPSVVQWIQYQECILSRVHPKHCVANYRTF